MRIYFVRVKHNRVAVGVFACRRRELVDLVDQFVDPDFCECRELPPGGLMFGGHVDLSEETDDECASDPAMNDIDITYGWRDHVHAPDDAHHVSEWEDVWHPA